MSVFHRAPSVPGRMRFEPSEFVNRRVADWRVLFEETAASERKFDRQELFPSSLNDRYFEQFGLLAAYGTGHAALLWRYPIEQMSDGELRLVGSRYAEAYPEAQPEGILRAIDFSNPSKPNLTTKL